MTSRMGKGADLFFEDTSVLDTDKDTTQDIDKVSKQDTTQDTTQGIEGIIDIPIRSELFDERLVVNVTLSQKKYVEQMAKKHKLNNSEFARLMIDYFIDNTK